jgi:dTDP-4-amino-4,6-dideoxygalactose transaminase
VVPFVDLTRLEPGFLPAWLELVGKASATAGFVGGSSVAALERALGDDSGAAHVVTCANGTDALQLALRALGVGTGATVLIPDLTFWSTFEAVVNVGARPLTVDCDAQCLQLDVDLVRDYLTHSPPPAAVVTAHLYGWVSPRLPELRQLCRDTGVPLVEDGAQCYGVQAGGRSVYSDAMIATTSFYPAKVFGAAGDGGAVFASHVELAERVRRLANHGRSAH